MMTDTNQNMECKVDFKKGEFDLQPLQINQFGFTKTQLHKPLTRNLSNKEDTHVPKRQKVSEPYFRGETERNVKSHQDRAASIYHEAMNGASGIHKQMSLPEYSPQMGNSWEIQVPMTTRHSISETPTKPFTATTAIAGSAGSLPRNTTIGLPGPSALLKHESGKNENQVRVCLYHKHYSRWYLPFDKDDDNQLVEAYAKYFSSENRPSIFYVLQGISFGPECEYVLRRKHWWNPWAEKVMRREIVERKIDTHPGCRTVAERYEQIEASGSEELLIIPIYKINMWVLSLLLFSAGGSVLIGLWMRLSDPSFAHGMLLNLGIGSIGSFLYLLSNTWCR